jgi:hypothetical protein
MPLTENGTGPEPTDAPPPASRPRWQGRLLTACFMIFALEVGLFLVIFPWQDTWSVNYLQGLAPSLEGVWDDPRFRGALTGLGLVNIYIACLQFIRLFRRN